MPATSIGQHVITDARGLRNGRQESTEELDKLLEQLQALVTSDDLVEKTLGEIACTSHLVTFCYMLDMWDLETWFPSFVRLI